MCFVSEHKKRKHLKNSPITIILSEKHFFLGGGGAGKGLHVSFHLLQLERDFNHDSQGPGCWKKCYLDKMHALIST